MTAETNRLKVTAKVTTTYDLVLEDGTVIVESADRKQCEAGVSVWSGQDGCVAVTIDPGGVTEVLGHIFGEIDGAPIVAASRGVMRRLARHGAGRGERQPDTKWG